MNRKTLLAYGVLAAIVGLAGTSQAAFFQATDNSASATITETPNGTKTDLNITLTNMTSAVNTGSAGNLLTGITFTGISGFTTVTAQSGAQDFAFSTSTTGAIGSAGPYNPTWALVSQGLYFNGFGTGGMPIIGGPAGSGGTSYPNANASLTSGPHGNYIYETADFTIESANSFDLTDLAGVNFLFNTDGSIVVPGTPTGSGSPPTPEPASLSLLGLGAAGLLLRRRK